MTSEHSNALKKKPLKKEKLKKQVRGDNSLRKVQQKALGDGVVTLKHIHKLFVVPPLKRWSLISLPFSVGYT